MSGLERVIPKFNEAYDRLEHGDFGPFAQLVDEEAHPDCEFHSAIGSAVGGGTYSGPEGIKGWFGDLVATTRERQWRNRRYEFPAENLMIFLSDLEIVGTASGAKLMNETGAVFEYEDGLCVRITSFLSHDDARKFAETRVA